MPGSRAVIARYSGGERGARTAARTGAVVVVVDAFRASTTIAVLVSKGARVFPVASIEEAASAGTDFRIGERGSAKVAGFDFGNSPTEILASEIPPDSTVALSTTNGTRIVEAAAGARAILTGAFVNAQSIANFLSDGTYDETEVAVIGCGWEGRRASEDEAAAGAILHRLRSCGAELDETGGEHRRALPVPVHEYTNGQQRCAEAQTARLRTGPGILSGGGYGAGRAPSRRWCVRGMSGPGSSALGPMPKAENSS